jgi:positive regulator of sigma E activity
MSTSIIQHQGVVQNIESNRLEIMIISESACSSCKSKKVCSISEIKEKIIYVETYEGSYHIGDKVIVSIEEKMGAYAVVFAYVLPFIVMISVLIFGYYTKVSEPVMGLSVVISLAVYFIFLYLFRNELSKKMTFKVKAQNSNNPTPNLENENIENS